MKLLALLAASTALSGCVAYPYVAADPHYGAAPVYQSAPYAVHPAPAVVIQGGGSYRHGSGYHGRRDRDRDGVPDRYDARPRNPYRY